MGLELHETTVRNVLTRTTGFLKTVSSHSVQPYRGCTYGRSLCGVGCYAQHNRWLTRGRTWGTFLEVRRNAARSYLQGVDREQRWARRNRGAFGVFMSSSTDPFVPQESRYDVSGELLDAMIERPPDHVIVQTHSHRVLERIARLRTLAALCDLRVHLSIESDRERWPDLPPPPSSVDRRFEAAVSLRRAGVPVVITVAPLLPLADPDAFFDRIAASADACVIDHFVGGDGSPDGSRTRRTRLPVAMERAHPGSVSLAYRDTMVARARRIMPGRVGVNVDGFAGRYLP